MDPFFEDELEYKVKKSKNAIQVGKNIQAPNLRPRTSISRLATEPLHSEITRKEHDHWDFKHRFFKGIKHPKSTRPTPAKTNIGYKNSKENSMATGAEREKSNLLSVFSFKASSAVRNVDNFDTVNSENGSFNKSKSAVPGEWGVENMENKKETKGIENQDEGEGEGGGDGDTGTSLAAPQDKRNSINIEDDTEKHESKMLRMFSFKNKGKNKNNDTKKGKTKKSKTIKGKNAKLKEKGAKRFGKFGKKKEKNETAETEDAEEVQETEADDTTNRENSQEQQRGSQQPDSNENVAESRESTEERGESSNIFSKLKLRRFSLRHTESSKKTNDQDDIPPEKKESLKRRATLKFFGKK
ncbi:hypothetical protein AX774_g5057 [Zancudomyces culisetae]|uniref:Uncharacterized protein n=1 Tax=Zancudomyces culisetae TaxID=1213189 RepID=A0A1R1PF48_ZANCU|nr:hypothetical protein AX774_g6992 [Zancudomyces culisetae]OMH81481.1 hypothetical protein AX774_g5057 [Zancudomyces culisetae]|eukprot:OMH79591.1 hypothetical protein AX774_g6992 [Zancudomyces culisetae]